MYCFFFFSPNTPKVWSPVQERFVTKKVRQAECDAENIRRNTIEQALTVTLGWNANHILYQTDQGVSLPDGTWMPTEQVDQLRAKLTKCHDEVPKGTFGTRFAALVATILVTAGLLWACNISDTLRGLLMFGGAVGVFLWVWHWSWDY
jgi:hypothetical protein